MFRPTHVCPSKDSLKKDCERRVKYGPKDKKTSSLFCLNLLLIIIKTYLFFFLLLAPLAFGQIVMDNLTQKESLILGVINFVLIKNIHYMTLTYFPSEVCFPLTGGDWRLCQEEKKII